MTAPTVETAEPSADIVEETPGELRMRFPVLVVEGMPTSDGRLIEPGALTPRALPLSLLAQAESSHGGDDPGPAVVIGRLDTMERHPGPEVVSRRTGEPFPEGTFVWSATGVIDAQHPVADLVRKGYLRGVSVDLAGMDYEIIGEDGAPTGDGDWGGKSQLVTHAAELAAATLVPVPAFGDSYGELADETEPMAPVDPEGLPAGLLASAVPAWRSPEVGDVGGLQAAGPLELAVGNRMVARIPEDAVDQIAEVIDTGEQLDATELATVVVQHIADNWAADIEDDPDDELAPGYEPDPITAAADEGPHTGGMIALVPADPAALAVQGGLPVEELHLTLAYLGDDVTGWDDAQRGAVLDGAQRIADTLGGPVEAEVMGHAAFNPTGANDREPCAVYLVSGDALPALKAEVASFDAGDHPVFLPHVTAGYGLEPGALNFVGPVVFNALRVALGEDATDIPLGAPAEQPDGAPVDEPDEIVAAIAEPAPGQQLSQPTVEETTMTAAAASRPPAAWFTNPELGGPTALRVTEDGRIYGHLAAWDVPHIGMPGQRVTAPRSASGYAYFTVGAILCDDGTEVPVGHVTLDTGHAPTSLGQQAAAAHYDNTGTVVADVAAGEDQHGIWVAGALRPGVDEVTAAKLRASALSGDWRRVGSSLELVAALAVNTPGFPIPRARVASGQPMALVAAGALRPDFEGMQPGVMPSVEEFADAIAVRLEVRRVEGELAAKHATLVDELDDTPAVVAALLDEVDDSPQRFGELLAELDGDFLSGMPPQLKAEWLGGAIAAQIAYGTPGQFDRCTAIAREKGVPAAQIDGMCADLIREATGKNPGEHD